MADTAYREIMAGTHGDPFAVLGARDSDAGRHVTAFCPEAAHVEALANGTAYPLAPEADAPDIYRGVLPRGHAYRLRVVDSAGRERTYRDPYSFGPVLGPLDEHVFNEGTMAQLWDRLGAHVMTHEDAPGTLFVVWAPNAQRVSVVGDFNGWDGRRDILRRRGQSGLWEIFIPDLGDGTLYKYEIIGAGGTPLPLKADPVGFGAQHAPETASIVRDISGYGWRDDAWMAERAQHHGADAPISIYEVHLGSWWRDPAQNNRPISYKEAAKDLVAYVKDMGFTHLELMPISEHPFDGSWGYQPVGLFAPTVRHGPPHEFRDLVDAAHQAGLGLLLDWVPAHFPTDAHGLGQFDGTALYEHADPREGFHQDWNTLIYNYGRTEVQQFLTANARFWLVEYHVDGLRVDAVASMLYRDYSRPDGGWVPNRDGGRENYEAIALFRRMNREISEAYPSAITVAEESTAFPGVTTPEAQGGLGFGFKWNMGWMNDTLRYIEQDPIHRQYHHGLITFGTSYAFSERFVLPISHDEVVHGKGSMFDKMPGDDWQKFANLRAYYGFMWGHPGKKLLFMGQEFAQRGEWSHARALPWETLEDPRHKGVQSLVRDLNRLYRETPALHRRDADPGGFVWLIGDAAQDNVFAWLRRGYDDEAPVVVVCNFSPISRDDYQVGLPQGGRWSEVLNTDAAVYGGTGDGNQGGVVADGPASHGQPASARLRLPPLAVLMLRHEG